MNIQECYTLSLSFLSEIVVDQSKELEGFIVPWVNLLLAEALPYENSIRHAQREEELASAPQLTSMTDEIPYHDAIVRVALPYGLASYLFQDDENDYRSQVYRNQYIAALQDAMQLQEEDIVDVYGCGMVQDPTGGVTDG